MNDKLSPLNGAARDKSLAYCWFLQTFNCRVNNSGRAGSMFSTSMVSFIVGQEREC
jgi:hypothetical protein